MRSFAQLVPRALLPLFAFASSAPAWAGVDGPPVGGGTWRLVGAGLVGMAVGCGGVAGFVLASEGATTNKTKRYIECGVAAVSLVAGLAMILGT
jgi:hypothetical protein